MLKEYNLHLYKLNEPVKLKKANAVFKTTVKEVSVHGQLCTVDTTERHFDFGEDRGELEDLSAKPHYTIKAHFDLLKVCPL